MLVNLRFKNSLSFLEENVLSMEATADKEYLELNTFNVAQNNNKKGKYELLKSAMLFGSNASGKSNVLKILGFMQFLVQNPKNKLTEKQNLSFAFRKGAEDIESFYEIEIIQNDTFYQYGFTILKGEIKKERLRRRDYRLCNVFIREDGKVKEFYNHKILKLIAKIDPGTLFLSFIRLIDTNRYVNDVFDWFNNLIIVFKDSYAGLGLYYVEDNDYKKEAINILKQANIGIKNISTEVHGLDTKSTLNEALRINAVMQSKKYHDKNISEKYDFYNLNLNTVFNIYDENHNVVGNKTVPLFTEEEFHSEGTKELLKYLGWILAALDNGRVILIDDIDKKLHINIASYIIELFNSISSNSNNAQLICTVDNVMLMDKNIRRDQIYFTSKNEYGESTLISLANYKNVRKSDLFSKKYLAGFYIDVPDMSIYK